MALPELYIEGRKNVYLTIGLVIKQILFSILNAAIIFFVSLYSATDNPEVVGNLLLWGTGMFYALILSMTWRACFITDTWTWLHHLFVWGSVFLEMAFMLLYSAFPGAFFGTAPEMLVSLWFWFNCVFLVPITTVLIDMAYKQIRLYAKPLSSEILQEEENALKVRKEMNKKGSGYTHGEFGKYFPDALVASEKDISPSPVASNGSSDNALLAPEQSIRSTEDICTSTMREVELNEVRFFVSNSKRHTNVLAHTHARTL